MWILIGDIGGTTTRLAAVMADGSLADRADRPTGDTGQVIETLRGYCADRGTPPLAATLAAAGPVAPDGLTLTNAGGALGTDKIARACGTAQIRLLNDLEAAAWALTTRDLNAHCLRGPTPPPDATRVMIGVGTGLGVAAMLPARTGPTVVSGEGGHVALGPAHAEDAKLFDALIARWPEFRFGTGWAVEAEALLCGTGLSRCHAALGGDPDRTAADICAAARTGEDTTALRVIDIFRRYLGQLAGDLALTFGAKGGVVLSGGVAVKNRWLFDETFLAALDTGGRFSGLRARLPVFLMAHEEAALDGLRALAMRDHSARTA
jgi:glucokinase